MGWYAMDDAREREKRAPAGLRSAHIRLVFPVPCRSTQGGARERRETEQSVWWRLFEEVPGHVGQTVGLAIATAEEKD
jgi:hypothetical protein